MHDNNLGYTKSSETCPPGFFGKPPRCSCFEDNTTNIGHNNQNNHNNLQPSGMACQKSCLDHPKCEFWTWAKRTKRTPGGYCYLIHNRANWTFATEHYVSGSKHCMLPEAKGN